MKLKSRNNNFDEFSGIEPFIVKLTTKTNLPEVLNKQLGLITDQLPLNADSYKIILFRGPEQESKELSNLVYLDENLFYLSDDDVIRVNPTKKHISALFRRASSYNAFLVTERCNSYCVMCSQPPKDSDDSYISDVVIESIPLIPRDTREIGITGGEPTLLGDDFFRIIRKMKHYLPETAVHVLSNGRTFQNAGLASKLASISHPDIMFGIPVYSSSSEEHDFIVQAPGAFEETIKGIVNLKRYEVPVEIRVVVHKSNYQSIIELAEYITRNLTFIDKVAFMGLELKGFAKLNLETLWIDPYDYMEQLKEAVLILNKFNIPVQIYNHPLCVLPEEIASFSVKSISDWKNTYIDECIKCHKRDLCGGFFVSSEVRRSQHIKAFEP